MSEYINASSTNNDIALISSRKYENDQLISPRNNRLSPNVTIFSQMENLQKNENLHIISGTFSPKSRDDFDNYNAEGEILKYKINSQANKFNQQVCSNIGSLNYLNQRDSSLEQSPERLRVLDESSSDKTQLEKSQKFQVGIKRTSSITNKIDNGRNSPDKIAIPFLNQAQIYQSINIGQMEKNNEITIDQNQMTDNTKQQQKDIIPKMEEEGGQNNIDLNNNNGNNNSSQGNGNSNPTNSQKQINDSIDFQRKVSNYSSKTQQYNTPKLARRNLKQKKNLTCATTIGLSPTPGTPLKGSKNRVFPQINNALLGSPGAHMLSSTPQQSQRENSGGGYQKSIYNSMRKTQRLGGEQLLQQNGNSQVFLQKDALSPTFKEQGQNLLSNGTLNTQFERKNTLYTPYATNTMNELIQQSQNIASNNYFKTWNVATRVKMINRFFQKVKNQTSQINFKYLSKRHFDLIDDSSCFMFDENNTRINQQQRSIPVKLFQLLYVFMIKLTKLPVLSPNATLITYWRLFYTLLLLIQMFLIPFQISFSIVFNQGNEAYLLYHSPLVVYCFNIFVCLNTGYYEMGIEQLNRSKVFQNYKYQFLLDSLVVVSFILTNTLEEPYFNVLFYLKFHQLISYFQDIVEYYKIHKKFSHAYTLAKLAFLILFIAHACGCIFQFISIQEIKSGNTATWLVQADIADESVQKRYLNSLYFSIITMITVGYGDIKPIADSEKMFIIFMTLLGSVIFAYVVNTIGGIFQEIAQKEAEFTKKKYDLSIYMSARQIKSEIQLRVMKFLDYKRMQEEDNPMRGEYLLGQLSENLKEEIQKDFYGRILQQTKIFSAKFSSQFLNSVSIHFKEKVLGPGEIVFRQDSYGENDIYFVLKGQVEIFLQSGTSTRHISHIKAGSFFGQGGFFSSAPRETSCKSTSTTHVLVLPQNKFIETLKDFPADFETYSQIKDDMVLYNKKESMACLSCGKYNHSLVNCHYIHYRRNRDLLIARYTYSVPSERKGYNRFNKTSNTFLINANVRMNLKKFRQDVLNRMVEEHQEQLDEDDTDKNLPSHTKIQLTNIISDKKFFQKAKKIKYEDKKIIAYSDDEDIESQLGEITECSYHSSQYEDQNSDSEYDDEYDDDDLDDDIIEADIDEEESHTQNEIQGDLLQQRKDEDILNSIQEEGEDDSKKNSQSRHSSSANIYKERLNQFIINLQEQKSQQLIDQNYNDNLSKQEEQKLGISEISSSKTGSSNDSSDQEFSEEKGESSDSESDKSGSFIRSRSESSPTNLFENTLSGTNIQPPSERQKSKSVMKQKKKRDDSHKKGQSDKRQKNNKESSNNSSIRFDNDKQNINQSSGTKKNLSNSKSKNNSSGQDSINKLTDKGSGSASSKKKKKRQNATQSSKNTSNNQSNASSIQSNSQIMQVLKGNVLKSLNNSNQSSMINNTNSISFGNSNNNSIHKKRNPQNLSIQVKNSLVSLHKKEGILEDVNQVRTSKFQQKQQAQESELSISKRSNTQSMTFGIFPQNQIIFSNSTQELNNLHLENIDDFNVDPNSLNNFLMVQNLSNSNQNLEYDSNNNSNYNLNINNNVKAESIDLQKQTPKKVIQNGFFKFGSIHQDDEDQQQLQNNQQPQLSKFKQSQNTPRGQQQSKQELNLFPANLNLNNNKNRSQSSASAPMEKLKKKSLLSREQSYRSLQSKISRESRLLQVQEMEELKKTVQYNSFSQQGLSKFSAALSDWNSTPILKHINGLSSANPNNYDQESSISLGGFNTPGRSIKGIQQGNRNSFINNTQYIDDNEDNQSIYSPYPVNQQQQLNQQNLNNAQQQQLQQQLSLQNKKSKFAPGSIQTSQPKRPSIQSHLNDGDNSNDNQTNNQQQSETGATNINFDRIRKEQERIRRNSPLLMNRHPLSGQTGIHPPRNSIRLSNEITGLSSHRNSQSTGAFGQLQQVQNQQNSNSNNNNNNININANQNQNSNNSNINSGSTQSNTNYQGSNINEELLSRLKELFLQRIQDDDKSNDAPTKRGSTMFGSEQNFYPMNPLYLDYNMFFFPDFDCMKEYENYFPHNNPSEVLKKFKGKQKSTRRTQKMQTTKRKAILLHTQSINTFGKIE